MKAPCSRPDFLDYLQGKVKVDEYVTHHRTLAEINAGFHDMHVSPHSCFPSRAVNEHLVFRAETASVAWLICNRWLRLHTEYITVSVFCKKKAK